MRDFTHIDDIKKRAFLSAYAECGNITKAAEAVDVSRQTHYNWLESDPEYAAAFEAAGEAAADRLEEEARRRAIEGINRPIYYKGKICGYETMYSDLLLMFLLKGIRPNKYRENVKVEHDVTGNLAEALKEARERLKRGQG